MLSSTVVALLLAGAPIGIPYLQTGPQWQTDYARAMAEAKSSHKMLLVYFCKPDEDPVSRRFEQVLKEPRVTRGLSQYVCVRVPLDGTIQIKGQPTTLLEHAAFREMLRRPGVSIVDFEDPKEKHYGRVVSAFPFDPGRCYTAKTMQVVLSLPKGTLTQRTMIFAVRIHPEGPASTQGEFNNVLAEEAEDHSQYQAQIRLQGHHAWESRFHQINARLADDGAGAQEVVAESWPGESLVEAAIDCVDSWRQSPGHWSAVRSRHRAFGYDIKRGSNGIWYATGIFARLTGRR